MMAHSYLLGKYMPENDPPLRRNKRQPFPGWRSIVLFAARVRYYDTYPPFFLLF